MFSILLRLGITLLALFGVWGVTRIVISHWTGEASCPMIGVIPACYIILIGYSVIVLSMHPWLKKGALLFVTGWLPITLFAITGVVGELSNTLQCPHTQTGIPTCYISAALALIIGVLGVMLFKKLNSPCNGIKT